MGMDEEQDGCCLFVLFLSFVSFFCLFVCLFD